MLQQLIAEQPKLSGVKCGHFQALIAENFGILATENEKI